MEREKIEKKVINIVTNCVENGIEITLESSLSGDLRLDSLDRAELEIKCEKEFGITFYNDEIVDTDTVKDVIDYIEKKLNN